jgi:hypothetical protein
VAQPSELIIFLINISSKKFNRRMPKRVNETKHEESAKIARYSSPAPEGYSQLDVTSSMQMQIVF